MNNITKDFTKQFYQKIKARTDQETANKYSLGLRTVGRWKHGEAAPSLDTIISLLDVNDFRLCIESKKDQ